MADGNNVTKKDRYPPQGPFAPPTPAEADQARGEPMAVAGDKRNVHGEPFLATTAPRDQMDEEVARKYRDPNLAADRPHRTPTPHGEDVKARRDENRAREKPEGYSEIDEDGFRRPEE